MINQTLHTGFNPHKHIPFGIRLKSAREAQGMDRKEVAAALRLHEKVIIMIESGEFKTDLPLTFIRGYIRNYSKLLEIPEQELQEALDLLKPKPETEEHQPAASDSVAQIPSAPTTQTKASLPVSIGNFFMQLFTYLLAITLIGLVGIWWHSHKSASQQNTGLAQSLAPTAAEPPNTAAPFTAPSSRQPQDNTSDTVAGRSAPTENTAPLAAGEPADISTAASPDTTAAPADEQSAGQSTDAASPYAATASPAEQGHARSGESSSPAGRSSHFSHSNPDALTNIAIGENSLNLLADLIMFLLIIKLGMRGHSASSLNSAMAGIRLPREKHAHRHSARVTPILPFPGKLKINWSVTFFSLIVLASLIGLGNALWHRHAKIQPAAAPAPVTLSDSNAKKPEPAAVASVPFNPEPLDIQLPSSNLQTAMLATLKVNALQALVNQLEDLAAQAEATRFLLTDKSTPIGQFSYPKKPRKKRKANYIASETKPEYNNNAPPYYYQQYNRYP